jgi:hypothetical protein
MTFHRIRCPAELYLALVVSRNRTRTAESRISARGPQVHPKFADANRASEVGPTPSCFNRRLLFCVCRRGRGALGPFLELAEYTPSRQGKEERHGKVAEAGNGPGYLLDESK